MGLKVLYVGPFCLPDKNAAAQRVLAIGKGIRQHGHEVVFLNYSADVFCVERKSYSGFTCYELPKPNIYRRLTDISDVKAIARAENITDVIAYNYPACALNKLIRFCRNENIRCFADATEWYVAQGSFLFRIIKTIDSEWRMRILHKKMDGVIAISDFLYRYYCDTVKTVKIPPTVDLFEEKWKQKSECADNNGTVFVYAGSPSAQKERLDLVVDAIEKISRKRNVSFRVVGITKEQYEAIYTKGYNSAAVTFVGRLPHREAVSEVLSADWSIIIREDNHVVKAGFPTKLVESISCGTPVITNSFSNIKEYLDKNNSILCETDKLTDALEKACTVKLNVDKNLFDYRNFSEQIRNILS